MLCIRLSMKVYVGSYFYGFGHHVYLYDNIVLTILFAEI